MSIGWVDPAIVRAEDPEVLREAIKTGVGVYDVALPFSQGIWCGPASWGLLKDGQQETLLGSEDINLGWEEYLEFIEWLANREYVIFHNAKFDQAKLRYLPIGWEHTLSPARQRGGIDLDLEHHMAIWDTQVCVPVIWPEEMTASLKPTADRLWGVDSSAEAKALKPYLGPKDNPRYDLVPWTILGPYAAKDTNLTVRLAYLQWALCGEWGRWEREDYAWLLKSCHREIDVALGLYRMERAGIPFAASESVRAAATLESKAISLEAKLPFKPTPNEAVKWFFSEQQVKKPGGGTSKGPNLLPYQLTKGGKPQFTQEVVERVIGDFAEDTLAGSAARTWYHASKIRTSLKMWYRPYATSIGPDGRLRTCFRQVSRGNGDEDGGTVSGRFSCERVNLQAIPHDYRIFTREVPTPRELIAHGAAELDGWDPWEFDLAQAELRVAAAFAKCETMLEAFRRGDDLHAITATGLFHVEKGHEKWEFYRQIGKRANFSLGFGAGGDTFARMVAKETGVRLGKDEADYIVASWNQLYPEFGYANQRWDQVAKNSRRLRLASKDGFGTGRYRMFRWGEETHKAFNQLVQGSLAEFLKDWLIDVGKLGYTEYVDGIGWVGLVLTIHDSLVALLPTDQATERADAIKAIAERNWEMYFNTDSTHVSLIEGHADSKQWG